MSKAIPDSVTQLIDAFSRLPGVGSKTAQRFTYYLLRAPDVGTALAQAIADLKEKTKFCSVCFNITEQDPCLICSDDTRDHSVIAVVEEPLDILAIERTGTYRGRYHVLHGVLSPRDGVGPEDLKIRELIKRVQTDNVKELIISTNPSQQGDATAMTIKGELKKAGLDHVKLTQLARGLPTGADLEYADSITMSRALQGRQTF